jgi:hypothetical protein
MPLSQRNLGCGKRARPILYVAGRVLVDRIGCSFVVLLVVVACRVVHSVVCRVVVACRLIRIVVNICWRAMGRRRRRR